MPKVYVTRKVDQETIDLIAPYAEVKVWGGEDTPPREELLRNVAGIEGLLLFGVDKFDSTAMDSAPRLKVIANIAVGYDNIDIEAATKRGIKVSNTPGVVTDSTADLAFALMLASARRLVDMVNLTTRGG